MSPQSRPLWCAHIGLGGDGWHLQGLAARRANLPRHTPYTTSPHYSCTAGEETHADIYANCHTDIKKFQKTWHEAVWYTSLCSLQKSHASQSALEIALGALVSLNMQKCPFIWLWALKSFSKDFSWVCCLLACGDFQELSVPPYGMGGKQTNQHGSQRNIRKLKWFNCCWY